MSKSIKQSCKAFPTQQEIELKALLNATQNDLAALRAAIVGITAKLDLDATVTDTNYAALWNPAALTLID